VVKCRPPGNRDPSPAEIETCAPFLSRQIELVDPAVIGTLGKFATQYVLGTTAGMMRLRGKLYRVGGRRVVPILHPAAALYNGSNRPVLFEDFQRLKAVLERDDEPSPDSATPTDADVGGEALGPSLTGGVGPVAPAQPTLF
jgi:uracil-DNA glycosylase family 4